MDVVFTFFTVYGVCRLINDLYDFYDLRYKKKVNNINEVINDSSSLDSFSISSGSSEELNIFPVKRKRI
jgi:hypothetical protein